MKTTSRKLTLISTALGIAFGTTLAFISANADDISYDAATAYDTVPTSTPSVDSGGYRTKTIVDEAYHEYQNQEVIAFETNLGELEQTEMAAFETSERSVLPDVSPWQLEGGLD